MIPNMYTHIQNDRPSGKLKNLLNYDELDQAERDASEIGFPYRLPSKACNWHVMPTLTSLTYHEVVGWACLCQTEAEAVPIS